MSEKKALHPAIIEFKQFTKDHPGLRKLVEEGNASWQQLFEQWYLIGEADPSWTKYKEVDVEVESGNTQGKVENEKGLNISDYAGVISFFKNINIADFNKHLNNLAKILSTISQASQQFTNTPQNFDNQAKFRHKNFHDRLNRF